jgi:hypothetical protein
VLGNEGVERDATRLGEHGGRDVGRKGGGPRGSPACRLFLGGEPRPQEGEFGSPWESSEPRIATTFRAIAAFPRLHYNRTPIQVAEAFR